jgi:hypothetical protein
MKRSIPTAQQRQIQAAREKQLRQAEMAAMQCEVKLAKAIQRETSCTWTEALRASYRKAGKV